MLPIVGFGGGDDSPRRAVEDSDSLRSKAYAKVIDLICEGEIEGLVDGAKSIYFDDTPLQARDGAMNFTGVTWEQRKGTQGQTHLSGWSAVESEQPVNADVKKGVPVIRSISTENLDALVVKIAFPQLSYSNSENGDLTGTEVSFEIALQGSGASGPYVTKVKDTVSGKSMSRYERSYRIKLDVPPPWAIKVTRLTDDSTSSALSNDTVFASYTSVIESKLTYPNSALVAVKIDSEQFSSVPVRAYDVKLLKILVPNNYDPATRAYSGQWNGTFKVAWSDNPAWCYYDLLTNKRYGLGEFVTPDSVDKWSLYTVGKYCDALVPTGDQRGTTEPRFSMNCYLQTREEAFKVLSELASAFRGMAFWAAGTVLMAQDSSSDPKTLFTNANVIDGAFRYSGSSLKTRHTVAAVTWNDRNDMCRPKVEYVEDREGLALYGVQQTEITAFGCTSRSQAHRLGKWVLLSETTETESVSFKVALEGVLAHPGSITKIRDNTRYANRMGGRVVSATANTLTMDAPLILTPSSEYRLFLTDAAGAVLSFAVTTRSANAAPVTSIAVSPSFGTPPAKNSIWIISEGNSLVGYDGATNGLASGACAFDKLYRVIGVSETGDNQCEITALEHNPDKFLAVDNCVTLGSYNPETPPVVLPPGAGATVPKPTGLKIVPRVATSGAVASIFIDVSWDSQSSAVSGFDLDWKFGDEPFRSLLALRTNGFTIEGGKEGIYRARVRAIGVSGVSAWAEGVSGYAGGSVLGAPIALVATPGFRQVALAWQFPVVETGIEATEIWAALCEGPFAGADVRVGTVTFPDTHFTHIELKPNVERIYRIALVSQHGVVGAKYPPEGVRCGPIADISTIINEHNAAFLKSEFYKTLLGKIDLIEFPTTIPMPSITGLEEALARLEEEFSLAEREAERIFRNENRAGHVLLNRVIEGEVVRSALNDGVARLNESYNVVQDGAALEASHRQVLAVRVGTTEAGIAQEQLARADGEQAFAQKIEALKSEVVAGETSTRALLIEQAQTLATQISAEASKLTALEANVAQNDLTARALVIEESRATATLVSAEAAKVSALTAVVSNAAVTARAAIIEEQIARASLIEAAASKTSALIAQVQNAVVQTQALVVEESTVRANLLFAEAQRTEALEASFKTELSNTVAMVASQQTAYASATEALASSLTQVKADFASANAETHALIITESIAHADALSSAAQQITGLSASVGEGINKLEARVLTESLVRADQYGTLASQITQVASSGGLVSVEDLSNTAIGGVTYQHHQVKIEAGGKSVAGFGLYANTTSGSTKSAFVVNANEFYLTNETSDATPQVPFSVSNGTVYMNSAMIKDADIGTLKLAGNSVTMPGFITHVDTYVDLSTKHSHPPYTVGSEISKANVTASYPPTSLLFNDSSSTFEHANVSMAFLVSFGFTLRAAGGSPSYLDWVLCAVVRHSGWYVIDSGLCLADVPFYHSSKYTATAGDNVTFALRVGLGAEANVIGTLTAKGVHLTYMGAKR